MKSILVTIVLITSSIFLHAQNIHGTISFEDSTRKKIEDVSKLLTYYFDNGRDSIVFEHIIDSSLTLNADARCMYLEPKLVETIDLNKDGIDDLYFQRECYCGTLPLLDSTTLYYAGVVIGATQRSYCNFEVWDGATKTRIFEIRNRYEIQTTTSTSCVSNEGYCYHVEVRKNGTIELINPNFKKMVEEYRYIDGVFKKE
jgi:hypothetical protein